MSQKKYPNWQKLMKKKFKNTHTHTHQECSPQGNERVVHREGMSGNQEEQSGTSETHQRENLRDLTQGKLNKKI